jgi:uncharacterized protein YkwD
MSESAAPSSSPRRSPLGLRIAALSLLLAVTTIVATAGTAFAWGASAFSPGDEQLLLSLTNQDRAKAGLNALVNDAYLAKEARWRAQDMGDKGYFSHQIPPANKDVFSYMRSDGYCFSVAGENIGYSTYPDDVVTANLEVAFMNSPSHRANILGKWAHIGVGAYKAADGTALYAVLFSIPCGATVPAPAVAAAPKATAKPTAKPTVKPTATAAPTATPSPVPTPSPTAVPTEAPTLTPPTPSQPAATAEAPSLGAPSGPAAAAASSTSAPASLRVHDNTASRGLIDSLFSSLFGGLFGW